MSHEGIEDREDMGDGKDQQIVEMIVEGLLQKGEDCQPEKSVVGAHHEEAQLLVSVPKRQ